MPGRGAAAPGGDTISGPGSLPSPERPPPDPPAVSTWPGALRGFAGSCQLSKAVRELRLVSWGDAGG